MDIDIKNITWIASVLTANLAALVGFFVSLKVSIAKLEVKADKSHEDINNLGQAIRDLRKEMLTK